MIKVLKSGFYTSIQDQGRVGFASLGVPISGVMDAYSANLANSILNNPLSDALIEITFGAAQFQFLASTNICISGGDFSPKINDHPMALNSKILVKENDVLSFGTVKYGVFCYLAVKGGIVTEQKLKSRSFYKNITKNILLKKGDLIPVKTYKNIFTSSKATVKVNQSHFDSEEIECYKGPEFDQLDKNQQPKIFRQLFSISKDHSRMGYRLNEKFTNSIPPILTSAVLPGTVQLTPSGTLIVLMRDCQVTGGYPRILQLSDSAICKLSQKTQQNSFYFSCLSI